MTFTLCKTFNDFIDSKFKTDKSRAVVKRRIKMAFSCYTDNLNEYNCCKYITDVIDKITSENKKSKKNLFNDVRHIYKVCPQHKGNILSQLDTCCLSAGNEERVKRKEKQQSNTTLSKAFLWQDLMAARARALANYEAEPTKTRARDAIILGLYSSPDFGPKRQSDLVDIKPKFVLGEAVPEVTYKSKKNEFDYSGKIPQYILDIWAKHFNKGDYLIQYRGQKTPVTSEYINKRLKRLTKFDAINVQYVRKLWATFRFLQQGDPKSIQRHAYELNHNMGVHMSDYCVSLPLTKVELLQMRLKLIADELTDIVKS